MFDELRKCCGTVIESSDKGDLYGIVATHNWWEYYHYKISF